MPKKDRYADKSSLTMVYQIESEVIFSRLYKNLKNFYKHFPPESTNTLIKIKKNCFTTESFLFLTKFESSEEKNVYFFSYTF